MTSEDYVILVLGNLNAVSAGQSISSEDSDLVLRAAVYTFSWLQTQGFIFSSVEEIPNEHAHDVARIAANDIAAQFGVKYDRTIREDAVMNMKKAFAPRVFSNRSQTPMY